MSETAGSEPTAQLFTGQRHEATSGLYDFRARWYDPEAGRFLSVDPVVQSPSDPQTVNGYGYVRNNPVNLTDPDGRFINLSGLGTAALINFAGIYSANASGSPTPGDLDDAQRLCGLRCRNELNNDLFSAFSSTGEKSGGGGSAPASSSVDLGAGAGTLASGGNDNGALTLPSFNQAQELSAHYNRIGTELQNLFAQMLSESSPSTVGPALHRAFSLLAAGILIDAGFEIIGSGLAASVGMLRFGPVGAAGGVLLTGASLMVGSFMIGLGAENLAFMFTGSTPISDSLGIRVPIFAPAPGDGPGPVAP